LSCINTILIPAAVASRENFPISHRIPYTFSLGVSIHEPDGRIPLDGISPHRRSRSRYATSNSHPEYIFPPFICFFPPCSSFYFSPSSLCSSFPFASSHFPPLAPVFPFIAFPRFPARRLARRAPLILPFRIALLCIISIAAGRPEVHIPYRMLVGSSYTYWMYACSHMNALMRSVREESDSRGGGGRGEARVYC